MSNPEINGKYYIHTVSEGEYCGEKYRALILNVCCVTEKVGDLYRVSIGNDSMIVTEQSLMPLLSKTYKNTIRKRKHLDFI